jgi:hypothetical protein
MTPLFAEMIAPSPAATDASIVVSAWDEGGLLSGATASNVHPTAVLTYGQSNACLQTFYGQNASAGSVIQWPTLTLADWPIVNLNVNCNWIYNTQVNQIMQYSVASSFVGASFETPEETAKRELKRIASEARAEELLLMCLTEEQRGCYLANGFIEINTDTTRYRIKKGRSKNIEKLAADGTTELLYCVHPDIYVPYGDNMLAQKLLLETDEAKFLKLARQWPAGR